MSQICSKFQSVIVTVGITIKELKFKEIQNWTFKQILLDKFAYKPENRFKSKVFISLYQIFSNQMLHERVLFC